MSETALDFAQLTALLRTQPEQARALLHKAAARQDVGAQLLLAQMYAEGRGIPADPAMAMLWYEVAANAGHPEAMNRLGRCHELGFGTDTNEVLAALWYRRAAEHGLDWGMYNLAHLYASGRGMAQDHVQALALYRRAAERGHAKSMNFLARYLDQGLACDADPLAARPWYQRSAEAGDFRGQAGYATLLADSGELDDAEQWMRRAIAGGHAGFLHQLTPLLAGTRHPRLHALLHEVAARQLQLPPCIPADVA
ncbi:sel1 repeat family protein [Xanthomonas prunicola]|uniref:Sel1 repeat family protein n=1 Tax=Xanthomonas prunicola TaxID=2053930 RepID=A0A9Q9J1F7_9XANT|nr:tetratricopeptide repeat protein [Xanthomonas prunicola]USI99729.1 sel1 repeat family protein [Xanthomonas prunicola]UXA48185.1 sel1 repeat family protein [Xanthomonas prunicola]UXA56648.1 sel1 repeat family protein [Xanthomonas prunicola]UXA62608.1 sel1 repeat family protein [Xanthomonas prunicola]UXA64808.1 sel1 repeat family protein [Xanthomonas prunicola]